MTAILDAHTEMPSLFMCSGCGQGHRHVLRPSVIGSGDLEWSLSCDLGSDEPIVSPDRHEADSPLAKSRPAMAKLIGRCGGRESSRPLDSFRHRP